MSRYPWLVGALEEFEAWGRELSPLSAIGAFNFWVNRGGAPLDRLGARPDGQGPSLEDAADFLLQQRKH